MVLGMTDATHLTPLTEAEAVSAALHVYADAIRRGMTPTPQYLTLHAAGLPFDRFMALADQLNIPIEIREPGEGDSFPPYGRIVLPFGAGILPSSIDAKVTATCSISSERMRYDVQVHNDECVADGGL